jgi:hypothetical protein
MADLAMAERQRNAARLEQLRALRAERFELMDRLAQLPSDMVFFTQITMEAAEDTAFLDAMRRANIKGALVGVEAVTPEGLKDVYKRFNDVGEALVARLRAFREHGVHVLGSFITPKRSPVHRDAGTLAQSPSPTRQSNSPIHNSNRTHSAIGIPMAKITNGMQSTMATAASRSPTTTAARRNGRRERRAGGPDSTLSRGLPSSALLLRGAPWQTSRSAAQPFGRRIAVEGRALTAFRAPPYAIVIDGPRGVCGDRRQPRGIPVLPAPDAPPVAAGLDRVLGNRRGRMAHRTRCTSHVRFIV